MLRAAEERRCGGHRRKATKADYTANLTENLQALIKRLHRMSYRPQPVRRVYTRYRRPGSWSTCSDFVKWYT